MLTLFVFWITGCAGLLIFRGTNPAEARTQDGGIAAETVLAVALYTVVVVIVSLLPRRQ